MTKRFRDSNLDQVLLLPVSFHDWLPEDHLARFIADEMEEMDTAPLYAEYQGQDGRGQAAYDPLMMTRLLLYGYCLGVTSSRRIERATYEDLAFRYLAANQHPDHDTIAAFRVEKRKVLADLFLEALRLCEKAGMVKLGNVAIDGTKILANASTRRSVSYEKLQEREQYWEKIIADWMAAAEQSDAQEDHLFGQGPLSDSLPPELAKAKSRLAKIREAKAELEREARQHLEELEQIAQAQKQARAATDASAAPEGSSAQDAPSTQETPTAQDAPAAQETPTTQDAPAAQETSAGQKKPSAAEKCRRRDKAKKQLKRARQNAESPARQYNFVDPDSRVMPDSRHKKSFVQAYNAQAAADSHAQVIVAAEVTQQINDKQQLVPMAQAVKANTGRNPDGLSGDCGYWDTDSLQDPVLKGIEVLVPPDAKPPSPDGALPASAPNNAEAQRMREVLATDAGKEKYGLRKATIEPVFGQIKAVRGIRGFRMRGLDRVSCEWKLICATHNLLKLYRHRHPKPKSRMWQGGWSKPGGGKAGFCNHQRSPLAFSLGTGVFVPAA